MKPRHVALLPLLAAASLAAQDLRIATVDLAALVRNHPSTEENKRALNEMKDGFEAQRDERLAALKQLRREAEEVLERAQNPALKEAAKLAARETARSKMAEVQRAEASLRDFVDDLQHQLSVAERERLNATLDDIQRHLDGLVKDLGLSLVIDSSRSPVGGYSSVLYADKALDITEDLAERIRAAAGTAPAAEPAPVAEPAPAE